MTYNDVINDKDNRRLEISLKNGGRIVAYCPMEGVHIFACDIRCGIQEEVKRLIMNNLSRGHFILCAVCLSGTYKHKKDNCIKVINPRDGVAERRLDDYPFLDVSSDYLGLVTVLYLDKMPKGDSVLFPTVKLDSPCGGDPFRHVLLKRESGHDFDKSD